MNPSRSFETGFTRSSTVMALLVALTLSAWAGEVFSKPPSPTGGVNTSSWFPPDGSDSDFYAWDDFTLTAAHAITEVRWRGGYALGATSPRVTDFRVSFFDSIAGGFQPLITALPEHEDQEVTIATFHTGNAAGESFVAVVNGVAMYDYRFVLPTPVSLQGGVKYWVRVVASQSGYPDWGMTSSLVGDGSYFRYGTGLHMFQNVPHNLSFALYAGWDDLGQAIAGSAGLPVLVGSGTLAPGSSNSVTLSQARPASVATIVLGTQPLYRPKLGHPLLAAPLQRVLLSTDAGGGAVWSFPTPPGLAPGTPLYLQAWIRDPAGPRGWAASNLLSATTP